MGDFDLPDMNPERPTSIANFMFSLAWNGIVQSKGQPQAVAESLGFMLQGMQAMTVASRATYIKLEQIEALIRSKSKP